MLISEAGGYSWLSHLQAVARESSRRTRLSHPPKWIVAWLATLTLGGCAVKRHYSVTEPLYPVMGRVDVTPQVDSLQPELRWKDVRTATQPLGTEMSADQAYDLCIWESPDRFRWGKQVYCVEKLTEASHRVAQPLRSDTTYGWAVRLRVGDKVGPWSSFSQSVWLGVGSEVQSGAPFGFQTPSQ